MDRRAILVALIVPCGCGRNETPKGTDAEASGSKPQSAGGQAKTSVPRVAMLSFGSRSGGTATLMSSAATLIRARLTELGHVDGKTIRFEESYADGDPQRLTQLARDLVESKPDVIVAIAAAATGAARQATSTIPIVMAHAGDPIESGVAASLSHPGGNVTGTTSMVPDLGVKQVELLRELLPGWPSWACSPTRPTPVRLRCLQT
jgi:putative ABC transport system substrate-binding protein